jgi:hypothetical protein
MERKNRVALTFAIYHAGALVRRETLTHDVVKLGRDPKSHLRIDDESASRMHAVIEVASPDEITLIDLGNEPGTMVNGARVNKCRMVPGAEIQIGATKVVLERAEIVAAAVPAVASENPFGAAPSKNPFAEASFGYANPFAPPPTDDVAPDAPEGSYTYALVKSAPEVSSEEVEDARASSVEVMIFWGTSVLHVQHLTPPRSFYVGEEAAGVESCDFFVPGEALGATRAPVVLVDGHGGVSVVIPRGAGGSIEIPGQPKLDAKNAIAEGRAEPCVELAGSHRVMLPRGSTARVEVGALAFQVSVGNAGRVVAGHFQVDTQGLLYTGISLAVHAGLLMAMAFFMPPIGSTDEDGISSDQQYMLQQYLQAAAEKEQQQKEEDATAQDSPDKEGGTGTRAKGSEGSMGDQLSKATGLRYGVKGPKDNPDPHIASRREMLEDASKFGLIGILNSGAGGDAHAPTASWGREDSLGQDPLSANGNMWGRDIGDAFGAGGLGLTGIGEGGGGNGEGIGLGRFGTIGNGSGLGSGQGFGNGNGASSGHLRGVHKVGVPTVRVGTAAVSGRLPPEVIQRIVRQNFGRFRLCYENGLRNSPNLQGRVAVRFVIGRDGAVSQVGNGGSDLGDPAVVSCVVRAFYGLSFPQPENGIVTVTYPIVFTPG